MHEYWNAYVSLFGVNASIITMLKIVSLYCMLLLENAFKIILSH